MEAACCIDRQMHHQMHAFSVCVRIALKSVTLLPVMDTSALAQCPPHLNGVHDLSCALHLPLLGLAQLCVSVYSRGHGKPAQAIATSTVPVSKLFLLLEGGSAAMTLQAMIACLDAYLTHPATLRPLNTPARPDRHFMPGEAYDDNVPVRLKFVPAKGTQDPAVCEPPYTLRFCSNSPCTLLVL